MRYILQESKGMKTVDASYLLAVKNRLKGNLIIKDSVVEIKHAEIESLLSDMYWFIGVDKSYQKLIDFIDDIEKTCKLYSFDSNRLNWNLLGLKKLWLELINKVKKDFDILSKLKLNDSLINVMMSRIKDNNVKKQASSLYKFFNILGESIDSLFIKNHKLRSHLSVVIDGRFSDIDEDNFLSLKPQLQFYSNSLTLSYHVVDIVKEIYNLIDKISYDLEMLNNI